MPLNDGEIEIYNNTGKMVYNTAINLSGQHNNIQLELNDLMSGLYYVNIIIDNESNLQPLSIVR